MTWLRRNKKSNFFPWGFKNVERIIICQKTKVLQTAASSHFQPEACCQRDCVHINTLWSFPEVGSEMGYIYPLSPNSQGRRGTATCCQKREAGFSTSRLCKVSLPPPRPLGHSGFCPPWLPPIPANLSSPLLECPLQPTQDSLPLNTAIPFVTLKFKILDSGKAQYTWYCCCCFGVLFCFVCFIFTAFQYPSLWERVSSWLHKT